jgi:hypothetical protein
VTVASAEPENADAGQEAKKMVTEGLKRPAQDDQSKTLEAKVSTASAELSPRPPKKCNFAESWGTVAWKRRAFGNVAPGEREKIIKDNKKMSHGLIWKLLRTEKHSLSMWLLGKEKRAQ